MVTTWISYLPAINNNFVFKHLRNSFLSGIVSCYIRFCKSLRKFSTNSRDLYIDKLSSVLYFFKNISNTVFLLCIKLSSWINRKYFYLSLNNLKRDKEGNIRLNQVLKSKNKRTRVCCLFPCNHLIFGSSPLSMRNLFSIYQHEFSDGQIKWC